jgi:cytochrome b561
MSAQRYSLPAIALHWIQAAIVLWLLWLGLTMVDMPKGAERTAAYGLHKSMGLVALLLIVVRLGWRYRNPAPEPLGTGWELKVAQLTHRLLYIFLLCAPLSAYFASSFSTYPLKFFGFGIVKAGWPDEGINAVFKLAHQVFVWGGAGMVVLHITGAIKHAIRGDGALRRMLPGSGV